MEEALYYAPFGNGLFIKASGHITAALCVDLRILVSERLERGPQLQPLIVDLSACDYMDSTFMGLLVGFNKRLISHGAGKVKIQNPSPECVKLLSSLGVLRLMEQTQSDFLPAEPLTPLNRRHSPTAEMLLKAHEDLSSLSSENQKKFSALQNILKQKMDSETESS